MAETKGSGKGAGSTDVVGDSSTLPVAAERRRHARMPVEMWVEDLTDGGVVHRRAGNLSKGGLYLDQTIPLPIGSKVKLRFTLPEDSSALTVTGQIVSINARDRLGMGVKFVDVDSPTQQRIDSFIERSITPPMGVTSSTG
jgi:type IV pilus assembly protein PilZ